MEFLGMAFDMNDAFIVAAFIAMFMGLFDHIWALILDIWDWLIPFEVITEYEQAVVLRWGVHTRTVALCGLCSLTQGGVPTHETASRSSAQPRQGSTARAASSSAVVRCRWPTICAPTGNPSRVLPQGIEIAG